MVAKIAVRMGSLSGHVRKNVGRQGYVNVAVISPLKERDRSQRNAHLNNNLLTILILRSQILFLLLSININTCAKINSVNRRARL